MKNPNSASRTSAPSQLLVRLLNPSHRWDYLFAFVIGALPIGVAFLVGAAQSISATPDVNYAGYLSQPNWWSLAFLIPAALFAFRWMLGKIAPVHTPQLSENYPPIVRLIPHRLSKERVYEKLRHAVLDKHNLIAALIIVTIVTVLDVWPIVSPYVNAIDVSQADLTHHDWRSMFVIDDNASCASACLVSTTGNFALVAIAYFAQYVITLIGVLSIVLILRHNLFFLGNVFQRRRTSHTPASELFQIDIHDVDRCFGFRRAYGAFNTQVVALMLGGLATLSSRYAHTVSTQENHNLTLAWPPSLPDVSFPVAGQWAMALMWLAALFIVAMPGAVKLLPRLPGRQTNRIQASISHYLQEFFADGQWPKNNNGDEESIPTVASSFAINSFWPTGDNRARSLFFFSYWIFFILLLPPSLKDTTTLVVSLAVFALAAYLATLSTFRVLRLMLGFVDQMLVTAKHTEDIIHPPETLDTNEKQDVGIFISYRRKDTIEYARSIHTELKKHFVATRLFRDLSTIRPGENFVTAVNESLKEVDIIIVLIGVDWTNTVDSNGRRRLHKSDDMVRLEVATALKSKKRVIPVLLEGASMPSASELPEPLQPLCFLNALEITDSRWEYDVGRLVQTLKTRRSQLESSVV